ncbi:MAG: response regulator transcription factor [Verrucomicrobia bacterium]|nr:response regulator transcription factor [Verrucomicrobiota bacterium]
MRILLADDHAILRSGLKLLLAQAYPETEFGEAETCQQALERALSHPWDIVILDISMPGRGGLDVLKEIRAQLPMIPVLILSMFEEPQFAVRAFRAGASGYLTKASAGAELIRAIGRILAGGRYVSSVLAEQLAAVLGDAEGHQLHERLSNREFELLRLIGAGKTVKESAGELCLSVNTVSTYRTRILEKMNMRTNADLTRYAINNKLVE